jgi:hypothetical protein
MIWAIYSLVPSIAANTAPTIKNTNIADKLYIFGVLADRWEIVAQKEKPRWQNRGLNSTQITHGAAASLE